jgi:hypothetical protein
LYRGFHQNSIEIHHECIKTVSRKIKNKKNQNRTMYLAILVRKARASALAQHTTAAQP